MERQTAAVPAWRRTRCSRGEPASRAFFEDPRINAKLRKDISVDSVELALNMAHAFHGYVEGGRVSRELGGTVTLCWAMILLAAAAAIVLMVAIQSRTWVAVPGEAWAGFWYAGIVGMFLGSVAWYQGLAAGGIARIGQLNLVQPIVALGLSALFAGRASLLAVSGDGGRGPAVHGGLHPQPLPGDGERPDASVIAWNVTVSTPAHNSVRDLPRYEDQIIAS
ncbi:DMT family transporter [Bradyrhizobium sp. ARR65]|uniref:DMT family transporter n=1 Tax=Bradyrhizobium sp. ARR65 TaxID=1040989 RepID=UPI0006869B12|nr:DMT family transporter [Bradyrhizobium sp. ARR65]